MNRALQDPEHSPEQAWRITALVTGQVQGVGYRRFVQRKALDFALVGHVENLSTGQVEVVAEGPQSTLRQLLHFLERGPMQAQVKALDVQWSEPTGLVGFYMYGSEGPQ